jgi:hypothetical protein
MRCIVNGTLGDELCIQTASGGYEVSVLLVGKEERERVAFVVSPGIAADIIETWAREWAEGCSHEMLAGGCEWMRAAADMEAELSEINSKENDAKRSHEKAQWFDCGGGI